jgi:hypothetical protein
MLKDLKGSGRDLFEVVSRQFFRGEPMTQSRFELHVSRLQEALPLCKPAQLSNLTNCAHSVTILMHWSASNCLEQWFSISARPQHDKLFFIYIYIMRGPGTEQRPGG